MSGPATATRPKGPGPGRPPTGARESILEAGLEVLKAEGYAGLTIAKVAAASGQNKALIGYHFGSKQGLVAAAGRSLGDLITEQVLGALEGAATVEEIVRGSLDATWALLERDERLARVYFDLTAVSVVEDDVREIMREVKAGWREVLTLLLGEAVDGPDRRSTAAAAVLITAGNEGLSLERIERGDTPELRQARELFIRATTDAIRA